MALTPSLEAVSDERKRATMAASRLEADILQTIIKHAQENHTPADIILLALANCTKHWVNRTVNVGITKKLYADLNDHIPKGSI